MNYIKTTLIIGIIMTLIIGCVLIDGSSLKSDLEAEYNKMFDTDFDYLVRVEVFEIDFNNQSKTVYKESAESFLGKIKPYTIIEYSESFNTDFYLRLIASNDPEYRKRQEEATLIYDRASNVFCSEKKCVEVSEEFLQISKDW